MPEVKVRVRTYTVTYLCDACGKAELQSTGIALMSHPAKYEYKCPGCGNRTYMSETYPKLTTETVWGDDFNTLRMETCDGGHTFIVLDGHPMVEGKPACLFCCMAGKHEA